MAQQARLPNPVRLLLHVPVPWVFVLTYLLGASLEFALPSSIPTNVRIVVTLVGAGLFALGAVIAGWGLLLFRTKRTTTVPGRRSAQLVTRGPYRLSRNPMYVGLVLAYLGEAGLMKQVWPVALLPLVVTYLNWIVIPVEEAKLTEVFGDDYVRYRASVRRWV